MKKVWILLLVAPLFLAACQKENFAEVTFDLGLELKGEVGDPGDQPCFEINFPITIILPDGTTVKGDSKEELVKAVKSYYTHQKKEKKEKIEFKYPISVDFKGETLRVRSRDGFDRIRKACANGEGKDITDKTPCLSLVYPVNFIMPNGDVLSVRDKGNSAEQMKNWFSEHPNFERERPGIQYPVDVNFKGKVMTVATEQQMTRLKEACKGEVNNKACFRLVYPLAYTMPDGEQFQVNSKDHADRLVKRWYNANPDYKDKKPVLVFPIKIQYPPLEKEGDTKIVEIADKEALNKAYKGCGK